MVSTPYKTKTIPVKHQMGTCTILEKGGPLQAPGQSCIECSGGQLHLQGVPLQSFWWTLWSEKTHSVTSVDTIGHEC